MTLRLSCATRCAATPCAESRSAAALRPYITGLLHACPVLLYMSPLSGRRTLPTFVAGGVAGCTAAVLTCPLEVIKTKLQSRSLARSSFLHVVRSTWLTEGYKGFFRGLGPLLSGEYLVACPSRVAASLNLSFRCSAWASAVLFAFGDPACAGRGPRPVA